MHDEIEFIQLLVDDNNDLRIYFDNLFKMEAMILMDQVSSNGERGVRLVEWLKRNHIPAKLDDKRDSIEILDSVSIRSPFRVSDCQSTNEIILDKIRNLVKLFDDGDDEKK